MATTLFHTVMMSKVLMKSLSVSPNSTSLKEYGPLSQFFPLKLTALQGLCSEEMYKMHGEERIKPAQMAADSEVFLKSQQIMSNCMLNG